MMKYQQEVPRNRGGGATKSRFQSFFCGGCRSQVVVDQVVFGRAPAHTHLVKKTTKNGKQQQPMLLKITKVRTNTTSTTRTPSGGSDNNDDHDGRDKSPYDTVSNSEDDETRNNTRNRTNKKKQEATTVPPPRQRRSFLLPTREIIPIHDNEMAEVSFLTIDPLLITVSTDPPTPPKPYSYPDFGPSPTTSTSSSSSSRAGNDGGSHRRPAKDNGRDDSTYYEDRYDNDNISDITGFREYSLISM